MCGINARRMQSTLFLLKLWVILQVGLCAAGWGLSAIKELNTRGYVLVFGVLAWVAARLWRNTGQSWTVLKRQVSKLPRRFRRIMPLTFLVVVLISLVGGLRSPSLFVDSLAYRIPRVLHWLSEEGWHWIASPDRRLNVVGCNLEWLWTPWLLFFKDEQGLFLITLVSYLFLPGVLFSFLRQCNVAGKVAWWWMWILPGGYCYAMQAGSLGTDGYSATVALAAVLFGIRGLRSGKVEEMWFAIVAGGLLAGIKQVNLPLLLVWIVPLAFGWRILLSRPLGTSFCGVLALAISALPIIVANHLYTGNWKGFSAAQLENYEQDSAFWGILGNAINVSVQNLVPPLFPFAARWNELMSQFLQTPLGRNFHFEAFGFVTRSQAEHVSGAGMGLSLLVIATAVGVWWFRRERKHPRPGTELLAIRLVRWLPYISVLAFCAKSSIAYNARYLAPYYPLLLPALLVSRANLRLVNLRWWRTAAIGINLLVIGLLCISRQRPVLPVDTVTSHLMARYPDNPALAKIRASFMCAERLRATFERLRAAVPPTEKLVAYAIAKDANQAFLEPQLWYPVGLRKVVRISSEAPRSEVVEKGIRYILLDASLFSPTPAGPAESTIADWVRKYEGEIIGTFPANIDPEGGPWSSYLLKIGGTSNQAGGESGQVHAYR